MKTIIENSAYLIIMVLICLLSIDFISMNLRISKVSEVEQYIEDYIEIYGEYQENHQLEDATISVVQGIAADNQLGFTYEYVNQSEKYAYYKIHIRYSLGSLVFRIGKTHTYDGLVRIEK